MLLHLREFQWWWQHEVQPRQERLIPDLSKNALLGTFIFYYTWMIRNASLTRSSSGLTSQSLNLSLRHTLTVLLACRTFIRTVFTFPPHIVPLMVHHIKENKQTWQLFFNLKTWSWVLQLQTINLTFAGRITESVSLKKKKNLIYVFK